MRVVPTSLMIMEIREADHAVGFALDAALDSYVGVAGVHPVTHETKRGIRPLARRMSRTRSKTQMASKEKGDNPTIPSNRKIKQLLPLIISLISNKSVASKM